MGYYFLYSNPLCYRLCPLRIYYSKIFSVSVTQWVLFSQIFAFCLFILFEYIGTNFPYLIAVTILLLSNTLRITCPCLLAIILDYSSKTYATLDSSLQFSVALLGAYLAGFISLQIDQYMGIRYGILIVAIIAFAIRYFLRTTIKNHKSVMIKCYTPLIFQTKLIL